MLPQIIWHRLKWMTTPLKPNAGSTAGRCFALANNHYARRMAAPGRGRVKTQIQKPKVGNQSRIMDQ